MIAGQHPRFLLNLFAIMALLVVPAAEAIETDQYFSWGRPLEDSTDVLNARVNLELHSLLESTGQRLLSCDRL